MTKVKFLADGKGLYGFEISGHCSKDGDDETGRIVCAAVSSAAYMAANTVTEIVGDKAEADASDAFMRFEVKEPSKGTADILKGLQLHLTELSCQYSDNIRIIGGAKNVKD